MPTKPASSASRSAASINASSCLLSGSGTRFEHHVGAAALGEIEFAGWVSGALDWFATNDGLFRAWDEATALKPEFREIVRAGIAALPDSMTRYLARWPVDRRDEARLRIELLVAHRTVDSRHPNSINTGSTGTVALCRVALRQCWASPMT
ncbi:MULTISPECIES: hypothetical protein [unclassified Gordonia (in: high G+C Gram-positive bacteria)]|uniref:hypothetical protein n=1 Tax=unclassified Gordonia (in: high G+C Gram-positive bacteria) TaxID=2657482 RepID=UPI001F056F6A|nr:hypothetical protein [Gordonia sp. PDNC005]